MVQLPSMSAALLPATVHEWNLIEKTVTLRVGLLKGKFLTDRQLKGARFFPANEASAAAGSERNDHE